MSKKVKIINAILITLVMLLFIASIVLSFIGKGTDVFSSVWNTMKQSVDLLLTGIFNIESCFLALGLIVSVGLMVYWIIKIIKKRFVVEPILLILLVIVGEFIVFYREKLIEFIGNSNVVLTDKLLVYVVLALFIMLVVYIIVYMFVCKKRKGEDLLAASIPLEKFENEGDITTQEEVVVEDIAYVNNNANYERYQSALQDAMNYDENNYSNYDILKQELLVDVDNKMIAEQNIVDEQTEKINKAIASLIRKPIEEVLQPINLEETDKNEEQVQEENITNESNVDDAVIPEHPRPKFQNALSDKLKMSSDRIKEFYSQIRNRVFSYTDTQDKATKTSETYFYKKKKFCVVTVSREYLNIYLAINPAQKDVLKYHHTDMSNSKSYADVPMMIKITDNIDLRHVLTLINEILHKSKATAILDFIPYDYALDLETTSRELLKIQGAANLLRESCSNTDVSVLENKVAHNATILETIPYNKLPKAFVYADVTIGELNAAFTSDVVIDVRLLREIGIIKKTANHLTITALGKCTKPLTIKANEYEVEALKMIILTGGNAIKIIK